MKLFWAQGYEPTSLNQLKSAMGDISAASFYAAFGSKEDLFKETVTRYRETYGRVTSSLSNGTLSARDAVRTALVQSAMMQTDARLHPTGCFMVFAAKNCGPENRHVDGMLRAYRERDRMAITACIARAMDAGDLSPATNVEALAGVISAFLVGMATEARDGASTDQLLQSVAAVMQLWDLHRLQALGDK